MLLSSLFDLTKKITSTHHFTFPFFSFVSNFSHESFISIPMHTFNSLFFFFNEYHSMINYSKRNKKICIKKSQSNFMHVINCENIFHDLNELKIHFEDMHIYIDDNK